MSKEEGGRGIGEEEQDSLDDGFFLCDLGVVIRKLQVWRQLFPRIKPFFAVKCNPDKMVTAGTHSSKLW
jgi:diaminopimelate decarboxylase